MPGGSPAIYDYDMATLPADATAEHPQDSVKATAVMGAGRWGDVDSAASGLQLLDDADYKDKDSLYGIPFEHACQYAADVVKRQMIFDPNVKVITILALCRLLYLQQHLAVFGECVFGVFGRFMLNHQYPTRPYPLLANSTPNQN